MDGRRSQGAQCPIPAGAGDCYHHLTTYSWDPLGKTWKRSRDPRKKDSPQIFRIFQPAKRGLGARTMAIYQYMSPTCLRCVVYWPRVIMHRSKFLCKTRKENINYDNNSRSFKRFLVHTTAERHFFALKREKNMMMMMIKYNETEFKFAHDM